jgi:tetratricopeptide (TPR) repeat protein
MAQQPVDAAEPRMPSPLAQTGKRGTIRRGNAARLFGYDLFISFALGPPPRGTHSYASDLARRLRERDFTVFFSEDEAPPGEQLDRTLLAALQRSKTLVVIANRGTLEDPRWVRKEVEEFSIRHPSRPVIPISVAGAIQDPTLADQARQWLSVQDKNRIWLDESEDAAIHGIASEALVERLALAPARFRSNVRWRWVVRAVALSLTALAIALGVAAKMANDARQRAEDARGRAEGLVQFMLFDLSSKLKAIGRLELMDAVNAKVKDYYDKLGVDTSSREREMEYDRAASFVNQGDTLLAEGKRPEARKAFAQSFEIVTRLLNADPNNSEWLSELAVTNDRLGDVEKMAGSLDTAQKAYEQSLALRERLGRANSSRSDWQRNLWVSYNKLGDVWSVKNQLDLARDAVEKGLSIAQRLAAADSNDLTRQLDLAASYEKLGDVEMKARRFDQASEAYARGLKIREGTAKTDPDNALLLRDLAMSDRQIGDAAAGAGNGSIARPAYERSIATMVRLAKTDPRNAGWQHDLGGLYVRLGDTDLNARDLSGAEAAYQKGLEIGERLTAADPGNDEWQGDLSVTYERFGLLLELQNEPEKALTLYEKGRAISERLVARNPNNAVWKSDLEWVNGKIAKLRQ